MNAVDQSLPLPHTFDFAGRPVRYGVMGEGPAMVLVHGTPFSSQVWRRIAPLLASHYCVYYFDLLGYGQSEMVEGEDVSLGVQNHLLAALIEHWGLDKPHVVAHDFGGATALRCRILNQLAYTTLTLIDPVAIAPWGSPFVQHVRQHQQAFNGLPGYIHEAILAAYIQGSVCHPMAEHDLQHYTKPWLGEGRQGAFYRQIAQMDQRYTDEVQGAYASLDCPVLLLWGEQDQWIPIERGEALARQIANCQMVRVPGAGHLVQEDAPEAIIGELLKFLHRQCAAQQDGT
ncbi:alpha/beta fold hydrolase [Pseudomonas sp. S9]|uniref:alpha/beta fold hydrolase n=1 Tax=Pseudomonas sp. S9 TaxID=686578 RepID=UPI0002556C06|nr:alpha/beta hydrolase [Pseudomonas sp. S9]